MGINTNCSVLVREKLLRGYTRCIGTTIPRTTALTLMDSSGITPLCVSYIMGRLGSLNFGIMACIFGTNRDSGGATRLVGVIRFLTRGRLGEGSTIITLNNNIYNSVTNFTTTMCLENVGCVRVPAALLSRISSSINKGATISLPRNGGLYNTFRRPTLIVVSPSILSALPPRCFDSNVNRIVGCNYVGSTSLFSTIRGHSTRRCVRSIVCRYISVGENIIRQSRGRTNRETLLGFNRATNRTVRGLRGFANVSRNRTINVNVIVVSGTNRSTKVARPNATRGVATILGGCGLGASSRGDLSSVVSTVTFSGGDASSNVGFVVLSGVNDDFVGPITATSVGGLFNIRSWFLYRSNLCYTNIWSWVYFIKTSVVGAILLGGSEPGNAMIIPPDGSTTRETLFYSFLTNNNGISPVVSSGSVGTAINILSTLGNNGRALSYVRDNSALHFTVPITTTLKGDIHFINDNLLPREPLNRCVHLLPLRNISIGDRNNLPLRVDKGLRDNVCRVENSVDSRCVAKLLLTLPILGKSSRVQVAARLRSRSCISVALHILTLCNVRIHGASYNCFIPNGRGCRGGGLAIRNS